MVYFDNASTTYPKPDCVYNAMDTFYRTYGVNAGRGQYKTAAIASNLIDDTRSQIKKLLKCNANYETVFTSTATEALNIVLQGINYSNIKTVYITHFEHNAVLRTLYFLQNRIGFDIIELALERDCLEYDLTQIQEQFIRAHPDLVVMTHASNVCGIVTPIEEISLLSKKYGACVVIDMAQTAGLVDTNITTIGADAAIFAGHKTLYGPLGVSGFVLKKGISITPLFYGGTGNNSEKQSMPLNTPECFEAGTRNIHAIAGLYESLKWIDRTGVQTLYNKEQCLKNRLIELLSQYKNIQIIGKNVGVGIVSCVFEGYDSDSIGSVFNSFNIAVRTGLHCAPGAHKFIGTFPSGTVRFSLGYFNYTDELDILEKALEHIHKNG